MHGCGKMHEELEAKLREKFGEGTDGQIAGRIEAFGGLLTRHAAVLLLCRQNGIDVERKIKLSQASSMRLPFSFEARVERIFPLQSYLGRTDRSVRLHVSDGSWESTLVLWNDSAQMVEAGGIGTGDEIECKGAYLRSGEITLAKGGSVRRLKAAPLSQVSNLAAGVCNVEGEVSEIKHDSGSLGKNGSQGFVLKSGGQNAVSSFTICEKPGACRRVVVWSAQQCLPDVSKGDRLVLENVVFKNGELHFNSYSRMARRGGNGGPVELVEGIESGAGETIFIIGGRKFAMKNEEAMRLMGIPRALQGVSASAAIGIKAQELVGKKAKVSEENGILRSLSFSF